MTMQRKTALTQLQTSWPKQTDLRQCSPSLDLHKPTQMSQWGMMSTQLWPHYDWGKKQLNDSGRRKSWLSSRQNSPSTKAKWAKKKSQLYQRCRIQNIRDISRRDRCGGTESNSLSRRQKLTQTIQPETERRRKRNTRIKGKRNSIDSPWLKNSLQVLSTS